MDETVKVEEQRAACEVKLLLVQSPLQASGRNVRDRFLHPVNISGDLCGHKKRITDEVIPE